MELVALTSDIQWMVNRSKQQSDYQLRGSTRLIPNSGEFGGKLPRAMMTKIEEFARRNAYLVEDGRSSTSRYLRTLINGEECRVCLTFSGYNVVSLEYVPLWYLIGGGGPDGWFDEKPDYSKVGASEKFKTAAYQLQDMGYQVNRASRYSYTTDAPIEVLESLKADGLIEIVSGTLTTITYAGE